MSAVFQEPAHKSDRLLLIIFTVLGAGMILMAFLLSWLVSQPFFDEQLLETIRQKALLPVCIFRHLTALPCPSCGMTRAMILIARGDLLEALRYNILSVPLFLGTLVFLAASIFRPSLSLVFLKSLGTIRGALILVTLLLAAWMVKLTGSPTYW